MASVEGSQTTEERDQELQAMIAAAEKLKCLARQDELSKLKNEREKATFSMMMKMNPEALTNIRKEFFARMDSVTLDEFIYIIQKHLVNRKGDDSFVMETPEQREFGTNMYELFKDIDVNGDGQLEWQEFTSFTVEKANLLNKRAKLASIAHYHDSSNILDPSARYRHRHDISRMVNIPSLGQFAVVEDHKNAIFVFNSRYGRHVATIPTEAAPIAIETISDKDKMTLVSAGADMTLSTFNLDDPNPKRKYKALSTWATPGVQMALASAPESKVLYSGATNGNIYSWNVTNRNLINTMPGHSDIVMNLIILQKLNNIASASLDKSVCVWDSHTNEQILSLQGHKKGVFDLSYSPDYRLIFSCGFEHDACVWSPFVNSLVFRLKGHHASLVGCQSVDNSPELITADTSGVFKLWDVRNFQCVQTFSANLTGNESKDNSKLSCFFHAKLPSRNALQKEDDSRIYAASKLLFSFDQARVVHEATTDYFNVNWIAWIEEKCAIITASDRNIIIWDALIGSKTFTHTDINGEEISACCLDDRRRKIILGDTHGNIGVYNASNGAQMKTVHRVIDSAVISLAYHDELKRFIAGYANGRVAVYDENVLEECLLIRQFECYGDPSNGEREHVLLNINASTPPASAGSGTGSRAETPNNHHHNHHNHNKNHNSSQQLNATAHDASGQNNNGSNGASKMEMLAMEFDPSRKTIATAGGADGILRLWDYESSKCTSELSICDVEKSAVVSMTLLQPYPMVATADSSGNIVIWGSRGLKWQGWRLTGFLNMTPASAELEPQVTHFDEEESAPRRAVPPAEALVSSEVDAAESLKGSVSDTQSLGSSSLISQQIQKLTKSREKTSLASTSVDSIQQDLEPADESAVPSDEVLEPSQTRSDNANNLSHPTPDAAAAAANNDDDIDEIQEDLELRASTLQQAIDLHKESEGKWGKVSAAQTMAWHAETHALFTGDDLGALRAFCLTDFFEDMQKEALHELVEDEHHMPLGHCQRLNRNACSALAPIDQDVTTYLIARPNDCMSYLGARFKWKLYAHNDRIISSRATPNGVLTSAADRLVKMWSHEGLPIGTLKQSVPVGSRNRTWDLVVDVDAIIKEEEDELDEIIEQVKTMADMPDKPNIDEMDFTGMQLGAESANFSQSVLRQRIDRTAAVLGLDIPTAGQHGHHASDGSSLLDAESSTSVVTGSALSPIAGGRNTGSSPHQKSSNLSVDGSLEIGSIATASVTASSAGKSLHDALREIKSTESGVDYEAKTKQMSHLQRRRKASKLESISKQFEERSGVHLKKKKARDPNSIDSKEQDDAENESVKDLDKLLVKPDGSTGSTGGSVADATSRSNTEKLKKRREKDEKVHQNFYSVASSRKHAIARERSEAKPTSNIERSILKAQSKGSRTIYIRDSCRKYKSYATLDAAVNEEKFPDLTNEEIRQMRLARDRKRNQLMKTKFSIRDSIELPKGAEILKKHSVSHSASMASMDNLDSNGNKTLVRHDTMGTIGSIGTGGEFHSTTRAPKGMALASDTDMDAVDRSNIDDGAATFQDHSNQSGDDGNIAPASAGASGSNDLGATAAGGVDDGGRSTHNAASSSFDEADIQVVNVD